MKIKNEIDIFDSDGKTKDEKIIAEEMKKFLGKRAAFYKMCIRDRIGDATKFEFVSSLGVRNFDLCIVTIGNDFQSSLEATSMLKDLGAKMVVSRAARDVHAKFLLRNGADEVVYPEKQLAKWTAIRYTCLLYTSRCV